MGWLLGGLVSGSGARLEVWRVYARGSGNEFGRGLVALVRNLLEMAELEKLELEYISLAKSKSLNRCLI